MLCLLNSEIYLNLLSKETKTWTCGVISKADDYLEITQIIHEMKLT